jgi:protein TonB
VDPQYTESARRAHVAGSVRLAFFITPNGFPRQIRVVKGLGYGLNQKAIDALSHWRFQTTLKNGKPVTAEVQADVQFRPGAAR